MHRGGNTQHNALCLTFKTSNQIQWSLLNSNSKNKMLIFALVDQGKVLRMKPAIFSSVVDAYQKEMC